MMSKSEMAIRLYQHGGPEVLKLERVELPAPAAGEVRLRQVAIGVNFVDIYYRNGLYPMALPGGLGQEGAGVVEALGEGVTGLSVGDRVAYAGGEQGAYSSARNYPASRLVRLPDAIGFDLAAAAMLKGLTAQYLLRQTWPVQAGETILVHAAAGGVGLILCQWAKLLGATVIGTVGSDAKAELASANGCDHPIVYSREPFAARVKALTQGRGVDVVYDSVGKDTFMESLSCLRPRGLMVSFGNATGAVPPFEPALLARLGSLYLTRPTLAHYTPTTDALQAMATDLFGLIAAGQLKIHVHGRYPLKQAGLAQAQLAARNTLGSTILVP